MTQVWDDKTITDPYERLLLLAIADFADDQGHAWPAVQSLASKCCLSERGTRVVLRRLESAGKMTVQKGGNGPRDTSQYTIVLRGHPVPTPPPPPDKEGGTPCTEGGTPRHLRGHPEVKKGAPGAPDPSVPVIDPSQRSTTKEEQVEIPGIEKPPKARGTEEEVIAYCLKRGLLKSDGTWFFFKCEGCGWTNGGSPIKDWRATVVAWDIARIFPSQKSAGRNGHSGVTANGVDQAPSTLEAVPLMENKKLAAKLAKRGITL